MRVFSHAGYNGWVMLFDGITEMIDKAVWAVKTPGRWYKGGEKAFTDKITSLGRDAPTGVLEADRLIRKPWPEAVRLVQQVKALAELDAPEPESIRRKPRWTDGEGDLSVDRALAGESDIYRTTHKKFLAGVPSVTLLTHLDTYGGADMDSGTHTFTYKASTADPSWFPYCCVTDPPRWLGQKYVEYDRHVVTPIGTGLYWRAAACAAAADILEAAGYTVDIWAWCNGHSVYRKFPNQFTAVKLKAAGQPLDLDVLCNATSHWFTWNCLFASFGVAGEQAASVGGVNRQMPSVIEELDLGDTFVLPVKNVNDILGAAKETVRLMEQVKAYQRGEITVGEGYAVH